MTIMMMTMMVGDDDDDGDDEDDNADDDGDFDTRQSTRSVQSREQKADTDLKSGTIHLCHSIELVRKFCFVLSATLSTNSQADATTLQLVIG